MSGFYPFILFIIVIIIIILVIFFFLHYPEKGTFALWRMQDVYIIVSLDEPLLTPPIEVFVAALAASRTVRYFVLSRCGKPCERPGGLVPYMDPQCVLNRVVSLFFVGDSEPIARSAISYPSPVAACPKQSSCAMGAIHSDDEQRSHAQS
ncbi:hypothetical protein LX32DRAFT_43610 [Colletotrichum zoysiae]|uniref:Uncharacterized protein n=1 Tax=Colletotrichum zoysiae TaxID=1216348 RepID=A0AAD9M9F2_9PEZI|nr:hypothetical protein LX32DRAFT_43610 [Colletotrichum zoysiae]